MSALKFAQAAPDAYRAMSAVNQYVKETELEHSLLELVKLRASYMNGCAYCVDMHSKDARAAGESEQRIYAVPVWRETPFFTPRERIALEWTEATTAISQHSVSDELLERARAEFGDAGLVRLTMAVIVINGWTRLAIPFRSEVGSYQPAAAKAKA